MDVSITTSHVPPGAVIMWAGSVIPQQYLECNGNAVSRSTYAELFAAIGTTHGSGDGSTTFNLPDYRGRFVRGVDGSAGRDPDKGTRGTMATGGNSGNSVGSVQDHELYSHTHTQNPHSHTTPGRNAAGVGGTESITPKTGLPDTNISSASTTATNNNTGGAETRPINAYVYFIIRTTRTP